MRPLDDNRDAIVLEATTNVRATRERLLSLSAQTFWRDERAAMDAIDQIEAALWRVYRSSGHVRFTLSIPSVSPDTFSVGAMSDRSGIIISLGGLIQEFTSLDGAIRAIRLAFAKGVQLHIVYVGSRPRRWMLESNAGGSDKVVLACRHWTFLEKWRRQRHVYKRNELIQPSGCVGASPL